MPASLALIISPLLTGRANLAGREEWLEGPLTGVWLWLLICCSSSIASVPDESLYALLAAVSKQSRLLPCLYYYLPSIRR